MSTDTPTPTRPPRKRPRKTDRIRYPEHVREAVRARYPLCRTTADKQALADELGIGSLQKLYNLASRLSSTQRAHGVAQLSEAYGDAVREAMGMERLLVREDPEATPFTQMHDEFISRHYGREQISVIAFRVGHTESATAWRARMLGLRRPARWWDARLVIAWLGITADELSRLGVTLHPCADRRGRVRITLVDGEQLAGALVRGRTWQRLVKGRDADRYFIREIIEASIAVRSGSTTWGPTWMSHGATCLNPYSGASFGLFYDGSDPKLLGADLEPADLHPRQVMHIT